MPNFYVHYPKNHNGKQRELFQKYQIFSQRYYKKLLFHSVNYLYKTTFFFFIKLLDNEKKDVSTKW